MAQIILTVFNLSHQVEYRLKITELCAITQKVISVKCTFFMFVEEKSNQVNNAFILHLNFQNINLDNYIFIFFNYYNN